MSIVTGMAFQATDMSRRHREVIEAARNGSAIIRDKDGVTLRLEPAAEAPRRDQLIAWLSDALRVHHALRHPHHERTPWDFGRLGWLADLHPDDQDSFIAHFTALLIKNVDADASDEVCVCLDDWKSTARAWTDSELRDSLLEDAAEPLHDVEL